MAKPKIEVELTADAKGLKKGAKEAGEAVDKLAKQTDDAADKTEAAGKRFDAVGKRLDTVAQNKAGEHLGAIGEAAEALGIDLDNIDPKAAAAAAGIGLVTKTVVDGVQAWGQYVHQVEQYADSAGISTEAASQFAQVFKQFGVEADDGIDALKTLAEEVGDAPEKFAQYSVEVVRAKDGSVDLAATMGNVAERFRTMTDPAQRAAMGAALFGDNWLRIAPLLEKGKKGLDDLLSSVDESLIITDEAIRQQREFEQATNELKNAWHSFQLTIGREAVPMLTLMAKDLGKLSDSTKGLTGDSGLLDLAISGINPAMQLYSERAKEAAKQAKEAAESTEGMAKAVATAGIEAGSSGRKQLELAAAEQEAAEKARVLKERQDDVARSAQDAARATEEQRKQLDLLNSTVTTVVGTQLAYDSALMSTDGSMRELAVKAEELNTAINQNGAESAEAQAAQRAYDQQLLSTKQAVDSQAKAAADLAKKTAEAAGQTFTAEQYNNVYRDSLVKVRDAANDPGLRSGLDGLIGQVDGTAAAAGRARQQLDAAEAAARRLAAVAAGIGTTSSGAIVGSADRIEGAIDRQSFGRQSTAGIGTAREPAGAQPVTIVVNSPIGRPNDVVAWMREELRRAERARR